MKKILFIFGTSPEAIKLAPVIHKARLVGTNSKSIFSETMNLLSDEKLFRTMAKTMNPYGDGKASERILTILNRELEKKLEQK